MPFLTLILTLVLVAIGWFVLIRPQQERIREQRRLVADLTVGDDVVTAGGIYGTLTRVEEDTVRLQVAEGVELTLARPAIGRLQADLADPSLTDVADDREPEA